MGSSKRKLSATCEVIKTISESSFIKKAHERIIYEMLFHFIGGALKKLTERWSRNEENFINEIWNIAELIRTLAAGS